MNVTKKTLKMYNIKNINEWEILTPSGWSDFKAIKKIQKNCYINIVFLGSVNKLCY